MKGKKDINKLGEKTQFSKENQPANRGRKPNPISAILKDLGGKSNINYHFELTGKDGSVVIKKGSIKGNEDSTINDIVAIELINEALSSGKDKLRAIDMIMDRTEGKPLQKIEDTTPATGEITIKIEGGKPRRTSEDDLPEYTE